MGRVEPRVRIQPKLPSGEVSIFAVMTRLANEHGAINLSQGFPDYNCDPATDRRRGALHARGP